MGQIATQKGYDIYLAGGAVRDLLLKKNSVDFDLIIQPDAISFALDMQRFLKGKLQTFEQFGTAKLVLSSGECFDFVTARRELYENPGAPPKIEPSSLKNDLFRRDFTINTMACSLNPPTFGKLYDLFGGQKDLEQGLIRILYNLSFVDDPLRILRAVRFEQRLGFTIEAETLFSLKKAVQAKVLRKASRGKLLLEIFYVFGEGAPLSILKRFEELGILFFLFPLPKAASYNWILAEKVEEALKREKGAISQKKLIPLVLYLCALYYDVHEGDLCSVCRYLRLQKKITRKILDIRENAFILLQDLRRDNIMHSYLYTLLKPLSPEMRFFLKIVGDKRVAAYLDLFQNRLLTVRSFLNGSDLEKMGFKPGPLLGQILEELKKASLDGKVSSYEDELNFVKTHSM